MNEADILINKLQRYYNVGTLQALGEKIGVAQTTISGWSTRNSVKAISRKIYELNLPIESGREYDLEEFLETGNVSKYDTQTPSRIKKLEDIINIELLNRIERLDNR